MIIKYNVHFMQGYQEMIFQIDDRHTALDFMALAVLHYVPGGDEDYKKLKCWIDIETMEGNEDGEENV